MVLYYVIHLQNNEKMHNTKTHYYKNLMVATSLFFFYNKTCPYTFLFISPKIKKRICTRNNFFCFLLHVKQPVICHFSQSCHEGRTFYFILLLSFPFFLHRRVTKNHVDPSLLSTIVTYTKQKKSCIFVFTFSLSFFFI